MAFLKSILVAGGAGALAALLWVAAGLFLPMLFATWLARFRGRGALGASSVGLGSTAVVALVFFFVAFYLAYRRTRHS